MTPLEDAVALELARPVEPAVREFAREIAAQLGGARAVLFYGSCLRQPGAGGMLDFYLLVDDYAASYRGRGRLARLNRLLPPNVFLAQHEGGSAKYAVMTVTDFARECGASARDVSTQARFVQPARLVWAADDSVVPLIATAIASAARSLWAKVDAPPGPTRWEELFSRTMACEFRAERGDRPHQLVAASPDWFARLAALLEQESISPGAGSRAWWRSMQRRGRRLQLLRLAKATLTFSGGIDYLAWKISRHSGAAVRLRPWHRRHPLLAGLLLFPRLLRARQVR